MLRVAVLCALLAGLVTAKPLQWPQTYQTTGQIILPYGPIAEPFTAIVDMASGKSYLNTYSSELGCMLTYDAISVPSFILRLNFNLSLIEPL